MSTLINESPETNTTHCGICSGKIRDDHRYIKCSVCNSKVHMKCNKMNKTTYDKSKANNEV